MTLMDEVLFVNGNFSTVKEALRLSDLHLIVQCALYREQPKDPEGPIDVFLRRFVNGNFSTQ
jgi:hypothetical protein